MQKHDIVNMSIGEVALVEEGFEPVNDGAKFTFFKAQTSQTSQDEVVQAKANHHLVTTFMKALQSVIAPGAVAKAAEPGTLNTQADAFNGNDAPLGDLKRPDGPPSPDTTQGAPLDTAAVSGDTLVPEERTIDSPDADSALAQLHTRIGEFTDILNGLGNSLATQADAFNKAKTEVPHAAPKPVHRTPINKACDCMSDGDCTCTSADCNCTGDEPCANHTGKLEKAKKALPDFIQQKIDQKKDDSEEDDSDEKDTPPVPPFPAKKTSTKKAKKTTPVVVAEADNDDDNDNGDDDDDEDSEDDEVSKAKAGAAVATNAKGHADNMSKEATQFIALLKQSLQNGENPSNSIDQANVLKATITELIQPLVERLSVLETGISHQVQQTMSNVFEKAETIALEESRRNTLPPMITRVEQAQVKELPQDISLADAISMLTSTQSLPLQ